jgi:hypothetical protein
VVPESAYGHKKPAGLLKSADMTDKRSVTGVNTFVYRGETVLRWRAPNNFSTEPLAELLGIAA